MTLRVRKTKEVCEKFNILEQKFQSEKSVLFISGYEKTGMKDCEDVNYQKQNQYYCDYVITTKERFAEH